MQMSHRVLASTLAAAVAAVLLAAPAFAQTPAAAAVKTKPAVAAAIPRTADGHPDLSGVYSNATTVPLARPANLGAKEFYTDEEFAKLTTRVRQGDVGEEAELGAARDNPLRYDIGLYGGFDVSKAKFASNKRTSLIVGPEGRVPPMLPEEIKSNDAIAAKNKGHEFDSYENRPLSERCILMNQERIPMLPGAGEGNLLQIVQGPGWVALYHEIDHDTRVIPTDGRPHVSSNIRLLQGDSVGHWEGNTLVVDTTNFTDRTAFRGSSGKLHLIERFTRGADDTITYQFTAEDPTTWDKPWTAEIPWSQTKGPVYEWACHEGNTMISTILNGARVEEREAANKSAK
jgi:hypothetical protein